MERKESNMAMNDASALVAKIRSDESLRDALKDAKSEEDFLDVAKKFGYDVTVDDFKRAMAKEYHPEGDELSDEQLDQAAGGLSIVGVDYTFTVVAVVTKPGSKSS
jgi:predicted ribosomally synthesized peptide with nif11-like leader